MLPAEGITAVLQHAVMAYPLVTIILVIAALVLFFGMACLTVVKVCRYWVLRDPHAGEVILALKKQEDEQARYFAAASAEAKAKKAGNGSRSRSGKAAANPAPRR